MAARISFADSLVAAWYCAVDAATPMHVRGVLLAALAYFVLPADAVPDIVAGIGFTDDAAVIAAVLGTFARHVTPEHRARAHASRRAPGLIFVSGSRRRPGCEFCTQTSPTIVAKTRRFVGR